MSAFMSEMMKKEFVIISKSDRSQDRSDQSDGELIVS